MPIDLEEEIAKAIAEGGINDDLSDREWPQLHEVRKAQYRRLAGTVLARLESLGLVVVPRKPTDDMLYHGHRMCSGLEDESYRRGLLMVGQVYDAMITEALGLTYGP